MGFDLGAIHAADGAADAIGADLASRPADWLHASAKTAASAVEKAFEEPRSASTRQGELALYPYKLYSRNPPNVERRMIRHLFVIAAAMVAAFSASALARDSLRGARGPTPKPGEIKLVSWNIAELASAIQVYDRPI